MLIRSYHKKKKDAKKEVKTWKKKGLTSDLIHGDVSLLGEDMTFFVYTEEKDEKPKLSFEEKLELANKKFFGEPSNRKETIEETLARANKVFE